MTLTVLNVAYPLAPVGPDTVGGAEQVLAQLDAALTARGYRSIVIACEGSSTAGALIQVPLSVGPLDEGAVAKAHEYHREAIAAALQRWRVDVVHLHGIDFAAYWPPGSVPTLATLHLPPSWYPVEALCPTRPNTWLNCVSHSQHSACTKSPNLLAPIENGVPATLLDARHRKRGFGLVLGRICPEKGIHIAIDAAKRAGISLIVAGEVFPYQAHRRYFEEEVEPRLDAGRRFIGPLGFARKRRFLAAAQCLLIPSLAPETSSLVAREAAACGTPVIAFPNGAMREAVEPGRTGFLVQTVEEMAAAIPMAQTLDPETCRAVARERFSLERMVERYFDVYRRLAQIGRGHAAGAA